MMLPHVVRFNAAVCGDRFAELLADIDIPSSPTAAGDRLAARLAALLAAARLKLSLSAAGIAAPDVPALAAAAATQWTAGFNPRPVAIADLAALYEAAR
jgi:alcohol dehydrogenase class IV